MNKGGKEALKEAKEILSEFLLSSNHDRLISLEVVNHFIESKKEPEKAMLKNAYLDLLAGFTISEVVFVHINFPDNLHKEM